MPVPGMMPFKNIQIQLVDTPAITSSDARLWMSNLLRNTDLLLLMANLSDNPVSQVETLTQQLHQRRVRLPFDKEELELGEVRKKALLLGSKCDLDVSGTGYQELAQRYGDSIPLCRISAIRSMSVSRDRQLPLFLKGDLGGLFQTQEKPTPFRNAYVFRNAYAAELKQAIYDSLDIIRVYTKAPGQETDMTDPVVLSKGSTVMDAAEAIHKDLRRELKYALIWGSGKYEGQRVKRDHVLQDGDIIEVHV
jgi:hypothetical protein